MKRIVESFEDFNDYSDRTDVVGTGRNGGFAYPSNFLDKQKVNVFFGFAGIHKFKIQVVLKGDGKVYDLLVGVHPVGVQRKHKYIDGNGEFMVYYYSDNKITKEIFKILPMFDVNRMKHISVKEFLINLFVEDYNENNKDGISISDIKTFNASVSL
jgi:hypothetical protein